MVIVHAEGFGCVMAAFRVGMGLSSQHMTPLQALATVCGQPAIPRSSSLGAHAETFQAPPGSSWAWLKERPRERGALWQRTLLLKAGSHWNWTREGYEG